MSTTYTTSAGVTVSTSRRFRVVENRDRIEYETTCVLHGSLGVWSACGAQGIDESGIAASADAAARDHVDRCEPTHT